MNDTTKYLVEYRDEVGRHSETWTGPATRERLVTWCKARAPHIHSAAILRQVDRRCIVVADMPR